MTMIEHPRAWNITRLLIAVGFFLLVAFISLGIFEHVPHVEDEAAYWYQAQVFSQGHVRVPTPPMPASYWSPFVLDYQGQRFGKYPPGYPFLLSLGIRIGAPWTVNALLGALTLWMLAGLGRRVYSPTAGLLAAGLGLSCPIFLAESGTLLSHTSAVFLVTLFMVSFARIRFRGRDPGTEPGQSSNRGPGPGRGTAWLPPLVAGLALGYLAITRPYDAVGIAIPFGLYMLVKCYRQRGLCVHPVLVLAISTIAVSLVLPLYWYAVIGHLTSNPYREVWPYDHPGFGPSAGLEGHTFLTALIYLKYNALALAYSFLGWPGYTNLLFAAVPFLSRLPFLRPTTGQKTRSNPQQGKSNTWDFLLAASFLSVMGVYATYWYYGGHDMGFPRYYLAALPALLLLTARGIEITAVGLRKLAGILPARRPKSPLPGQFGPVLLYVIVLFLVAYNTFVFLPPRLEALKGKYGITTRTLEIVQRANIDRAIVFVGDYEYWHDFAPFFAANNPTLDSDRVFAIYYDRRQAKSLRSLYPDRACYLLCGENLCPCSFESD